MPAIQSKISDLDSMQIIMDQTANELQGLAYMFSNVFVEAIKKSFPDGVDVNKVTEQVSLLKTILCGYTAKESAIADVITAVTKKESIDLGINPRDICFCFDKHDECDC